MNRGTISVEAFLEAADTEDDSIDDTVDDMVDDVLDDAGMDEGDADEDESNDDNDESDNDDMDDDNDESDDDDTDDDDDEKPSGDIVGYIQKRDDQDFDKKIKVRLIRALNDLVALCDKQLIEISDDHRVTPLVQKKMELEKKELTDIKKLLRAYVLDSAPVRSRDEVLEKLISFKEVYENIIKSINAKIEPHT